MRARASQHKPPTYQRLKLSAVSLKYPRTEVQEHAPATLRCCSFRNAILYGTTHDTCKQRSVHITTSHQCTATSTFGIGVYELGIGV
jgi:hypothetical protein